MTWAIRRLDAAADRAAFASTSTELNTWLSKQANQAQKKRLASVFVASPVDQPACIVGYYSLAPWQIAFEQAPAKVTKRLPRYPLAATLLARLAVDQSFQGQGLGGVLLIDALKRIHLAAQSVPVQVALVHAKDDAAAAFYRRYGFEAFADEPLHLFMAMGTVEQLFAD